MMEGPSRPLLCLADLHDPQSVKSVRLRQAAPAQVGTETLGAGNSGSTAGIPNTLSTHKTTAARLVSRALGKGKCRRARRPDPHLEQRSAWW